MDQKDFEDLKNGLQEVLEIEKGSRKPAKQYSIESIKSIRERYDFSQREFSHLLGISVRTLQNWEQGTRLPTGAARILLEVTARHPEAVLDTIQQLSESS